MTGSTLSRRQIIDTIVRAVEPLPFVHAAWLGGSDATGRTDEWSDVDIQLIVDDDLIDDAYRAVHGGLEALSPIEERFRFPQPTWHGHEQELLRLRDADPCHFIDLVIIKRTSGDRFLEPERHGTPVVLFDRENLLQPVPLDRTAHLERMRKRLPALRTQFSLYQNLVTKAARRRAGADAMGTYIAATIRPLVELLRMRYCPERYDFGLRYLDRDLPPGLRDQVESLVYPGSVDELESYRGRAEAIFGEELRALDAGEWTLRV